MKSTFSKKDFFVLTGCILFAIANIGSVGKWAGKMQEGLSA